MITLHLTALFSLITGVLLLCSTLIDGEFLQYYKKTKYTLAHQWWQHQQQSPMMTTDIGAAQFPYKTNDLSRLTDEMRLSDAIMPPLNPVPMLKPNPFVNSIGGQIRFDGKRNPLRRMEGDFCRRSFDGRSGYCILATHCLHVVKEYRVHGTKIDVCTYRRRIAVICCPLAEKHVELQRISAQKCQEYHSEALHGIKVDMPRQFSGKLCVPSVPMIVGGVVVHNVNDYPHMAALGWTQQNDRITDATNNNTSIKWGCGGTLISRQFVLSAAHCATSDEKPPDLVRVGTLRLNGSDAAAAAAQQEDIKILIIILHPKYRSSSYYHDIALLKLARRVELSAHIRPACLWQLQNIDIHTSAIATGWGRTDFMGTQSEELRKVDLRLIDQEQCKAMYKTERRLARGIIDGQFCAGHLTGGKDTCQGDSGGPLHAELPEYNCVKFVIGITSFGKFCAAPNAPGVYTKIHSYLDWIERIVFHDETS